MQNSSIEIPQWALERIRVAEEQNLEVLDLSLAIYFDGARLTTLPDEIFKLPGLTSLNLSGNQLRILPKSIAQLQNLTTLNLSGNQIITIPASIDKLRSLRYLVLSHNQLNTIPESITNLQSLTTLYLSRNQFSTFPEWITKLQNLMFLDLSDNQISTLPESIGQLQNLTTLQLSHNQLNSLPESIAQLQNLKTLGLSGNHLVSPPIEIATKGIKSIGEYFRQLDKEGVDYLYEAKLLILGEGGAGKTTLANKILYSNYVLKEEDTTRGVDVLKWSFLTEGYKQFNVNVWDFGGQEIYHATHQFFLTKRSLYILVADTRKDDTDFYYWLNIAELLSDGSPLLIIKNEKQDRHRELSERQLKGQFESLKGIIATNLATNRGLETVREEIKYYIKKLPHIGSHLPKTWVRVRDMLEKDQRNHISLEEYLAVCDANGFNETKDSLQLSGYLHDIGVFLHFQDDPLLRKTVILKPKWGTEAVYKVLDNQTVIRNLGHFTRTDLERIWMGYEYEDKRDELLQLMMKFKLCYEIPSQQGAYIAPQLLTENQPEYDWDERENLLLRYSYEFMPKGILTQFIVVMHRFILEQKIVWKSGVVIEKMMEKDQILTEVETKRTRDAMQTDRTRAEVIEYHGKREIHVRVAGGQRRDWMTVIRYELKQIHDTYRRLRYDELIQCNCSTCKDNLEPHFYSIAELMDFRENGQLEIQCRKKPYHMVSVMRLLGDVIDLSKPLEQDKVPSIYIQGDYIEGDKKMNDKKISISGSTVYGSVIASESIKDSFNVIEKSNIKDDLKEQLKQLAQAVDVLAKQLPEEKAEEVAEDMKVLAEQATKEKPNPKWYNVSIDGLVAAAQNLGKVGDAVIELTRKVRGILTGSLL